MRSNLVHDCACYRTIQVCRELLAEMRALTHLAPFTLIASVSIG